MSLSSFHRYRCALKPVVRLFMLLFEYLLLWLLLLPPPLQPLLVLDLGGMYAYATICPGFVGARSGCCASD